jgi:cation transport ATPase
LFSGAGGHVYFMKAAAIISFIRTGHWLEARVSDKANGVLKLLFGSMYFTQGVHLWFFLAVN